MNRGRGNSRYWRNKRGRGGHQNDNPYNDVRDWRKRVYEDTIKIFRNGSYFNEDNEEQVLPPEELMKEVRANIYIQDPSVYFPEVFSDELTGTKARNYDPARDKLSKEKASKSHDIRNYFGGTHKKSENEEEEEKKEKLEAEAVTSTDQTLYPDLNSLRDKHATVVNVVEGDCLVTALQLQEKGFNPVVLNMASCWKPGGGVKNGAGAQEENLFRRTNYFMHLTENHVMNSKYPTSLYAGIYSPNVSVIKGAESDKYELLPVASKMSFIAVAALKSPELNMLGHKLPQYHTDSKVIMQGKIRTILTLAVIGGHDCPVLSAFGCGAYHNPPNAVASLFKEVIENDFRGVFKKVVFAIIEDNNSRGRLNPSGNVKPFEDAFARVEEEEGESMGL